MSTELDWLAQRQEWPGLQAVAMLESSREIGDKVSCGKSYSSGHGK